MVRGSKVRMNGVSSDDAMPVRMDEHSKSKGKTGMPSSIFRGYDPADTQPIPIGTKVRIFDSRGFNIFDRSLRTEAKTERQGHGVVSGYRDSTKSGQRYEKHEIMAVKCTNWREVELEFARAKEEYDRKL